MRLPLFEIIGARMTIKGARKALDSLPPKVAASRCRHRQRREQQTGVWGIRANGDWSITRIGLPQNPVSFIGRTIEDTRRENEPH